MSSRRDYIALAVAIRDVMDETTPGYEAPVEEVARRIADVFEDDNPNFDRDRFLAVCGVK